MICVCKPKKPCRQDSDDDSEEDDDDDSGEDFDGADLFSNPTELEYERKCRVCRDVGMKWTKCEEGDGCPDEVERERCERRPRPGRRERPGRRDRPGRRRNRNRPSQLKAGGFA